MVNYEDLPLFPLHVVLFPEMPLPLHIFEPRYREMILRCRAENSPFGVVLIGSGEETGAEAVPQAIGTTAKIMQFEEMPDGRMNILVFGEMRFQVARTFRDKPYLSAHVRPFSEEASEPGGLREATERAAELFRQYLRTLFASTGRPLSTLQLPQDPEYLSYAIASVLQVPSADKQCLLELTDTAARLTRECDLLRAEIEAQGSVSGMTAVKVSAQELSKLASLN
jgi:Lon protease-like protein